MGLAACAREEAHVTTAVNVEPTPSASGALPVPSPKRDLPVVTIGCNDAPGLSLDEQELVSKRLFPNWAVAPRSAVPEMWKRPDGELDMVARGAFDEGPAWMRATGPTSEIDVFTHVLNRRAVGEHVVTVTATHARPMSQGHPDAALISAVSSEDPAHPVVLGLLGEWSQCDGAVHLFASQRGRLEVILESFSSNHGFVHVTFSAHAWLLGDEPRVVAVAPPLGDFLIDDCGAREVCTAKQIAVVPRAVPGGYELWLSETGREVVDEKPSPIDRQRRLATVLH